MVSIVITTKNEEKVLGDLLGSLKTQSFKNFKTILVDNNSRDSTIEIAKKYRVKTFTKGPERSVQRNFGVDKAKGKYILILDADMKLTKDVLKECDQEMAQNPTLAGLIIPEKSFGVGFWAKCKAFEREFYVGEESIEAARFFKRDLFQKFEGYDVSMTGPEDYDLPLRMKKSGLKIGRIKSYILHNEKKFSPLGSAKKKFYYASKARVYLKKHPEMAIKQGNLVFRPVFFKKWRKMLSHPVLAIGMFIIKTLEMAGALVGVLYSGFSGIIPNV